MSTAWTLAGPRSGQEAPPPGWPPPPPGPPVDPDEVLTGDLVLEPDRYPTRPVRPVAQLAIRTALWGAVAFGCLGGLVSLLGLSSGESPPPPSPPADSTMVPAPVAGEAEVVVRGWLTATADDQDQLAALFVDPPDLSAVPPDTVSVGAVTAIGGRVLQKNYWTVTVAAQVNEKVHVVDPDSTDPAAGENAPAGSPAADTRVRAVTWYLEVPIVGDPTGGLAALTTPAVLPGRPPVSTGWHPSLNAPDEPASDDPTAQTARGFLSALLTGSGDPERYVSPGVHVAAADPPPFSQIEVADMATDELKTGEFRVLVRVWATTPGGARRLLSYELVMVQRVDRLEISRWSGAPTMVAGSAEPPAPKAAQGAGTTVATTEGGG